MNIKVITIATEKYIMYFKGFIESIHYFFPGEYKKVMLLTDFMGELNLEPSVSYERRQIYPLIYPTININKPIFFNNELNDFFDYTFIIDIDTVFRRVPDYIWSNLKEKMSEGAILLNSHPFYRLNDDATLWNMSKEGLIQNLYTANLTEKDERFSSYIPDGEYTYINSSFWGGKTNILKKFNDTIIELMQRDLTKYPFGYHIPKYLDENYINYLYYQNMFCGDKTFTFNVNGYSVLANIESYINDYVFMYQKNMNDSEIKTNRR